MYLRLMLAFLIAFATTINAVAQQVEPYSVPRTEHGQPDLQGVWQDAFLTFLERPPGVENLIAEPEQATAGDRLHGP